MQLFTQGQVGEWRLPLFPSLLHFPCCFSLQEEEVVSVIKAKPVPYFGVPFKPKAAEPRQVEMCPFSFDSRDKERLLQKEKKIEELQKEEVGAFHLGTPFSCWGRGHPPPDTTVQKQKWTFAQFSM